MAERELTGQHDLKSTQNIYFITRTLNTLLNDSSFLKLPCFYHICWIHYSMTNKDKCGWTSVLDYCADWLFKCLVTCGCGWLNYIALRLYIY